MWWIIGYLIGCVISYILISIHNDSHFYDKMSGFWIVTSWVVPLSILMGMFIHFISNINFYPSLKWFKFKK